MLYRYSRSPSCKILQLPQYGFIRKFHIIMILPGSQITAHHHCTFQIQSFSFNLIKANSRLQQRDCWFLIHAAGIQRYCRSIATFHKFPVIKLKCPSCCCHIFRLLELCKSAAQPACQITACSSILIWTGTVIIPGLSQPSVLALHTCNEVTEPFHHCQITASVNSCIQKHVIGF